MCVARFAQPLRLISNRQIVDDAKLWLGHLVIADDMECCRIRVFAPADSVADNVATIVMGL